MLNDDDKTTHSSAWLWPAEWAVERAFWREVGTRTIAGVMTIVVIGVPTLLWAAISGALQWETVAPIIVGIAFFGIVGVIYTSIVVGIRRREAQEIQAALAPEKYISEVLPDPSLLDSLPPDKRKIVMDGISDAGRATIAQAMRTARQQSLFAAIGGIVAILATTIGIASVTPTLLDLFIVVPGSNN